MYRMPDRQLSLDDFYLGFNGSLDSENRWVKLARLIPWEAIDGKRLRRSMRHYIRRFEKVLADNSGM